MGWHVTGLLSVSSFTRYMADIGMFGKVRKPTEHLVLSQVAGARVGGAR